MAAAKLTAAERVELLGQAPRLGLVKGATVYTILRHVSRSGALRSIDLFTIQDSQPWCVSWLFSRLSGRPYDKKNGGVRVTGGGMDMGFECVYNLGHEVFGAPGWYDRGEADPGYSFSHRWL